MTAPGRPLAASGRPLAAWGRPLAASGRPLAAVRAGVLALAALLTLAACGGGSQGEPANGGQALPTPQQSSSTGTASTVTLLSDKLAGAGFQMLPPSAPYRPSEPASLTQTPRAIFQIYGADADQGFVVIYDFPTEAAAAAAGTELASYLGSGFGQTNFPLDAQFSVTQVGSTIVSTWYSGARASDPGQAREAFLAVGSVGQPFPVVK